jgi:hypothetical protein
MSSSIDESLKKRKFNQELEIGSKIEILQNQIHISEQNALIAKERKCRIEESEIIKTLLDENKDLRTENNTLKVDSARKYYQLLTVTTDLEHRFYASQNLLHESIIKEGKPFSDENEALKCEINNLKIDSSQKYDQLLTVTTELEQRLFITQNQLNESIAKKKESGKFIKYSNYKQYRESSEKFIMDRLEGMNGCLSKFQDFFNVKRQGSYGFCVLFWKDLESFQYNRLMKKSYEFRTIRSKVFLFHTTNTFITKDIGNEFVFVMVTHYGIECDSFVKRHADSKIKKLCNLFVDSLNY